MMLKNTVLTSINNEDESRCVDIFRRGDNTFGFEEYRRDIEDNRGWFPVGFFSGKTFDTREQALESALAGVSWLATARALK